jgi:dienelactone hydrolase
MMALPPDAGPPPTAPMAVVAQAPLITVDPVILPASTLGRRLLLRVTAPLAGRHLPVIMLSHGNRLSREDYRPLVDGWARAGFLVVQVDHEDAATDGFPPAVTPPDMWRTRITDIRRAIDALPRIAATVPGLAGRIDGNRIALVGHSLGAFTAEWLDGARPAQDAPTAPDPRIKATILLSPPGVYRDLTPQWRGRSPYLDVDFGAMHGPLLVVSGGADAGGVMSPRDASWRQDAFRLAPDGQACLVVVAGAGHYLGGINGPAMKPDGDATPQRLALVRSVTTRFLRAMLIRPDPGYRDWIAGLSGQPAVGQATCK